MKTFKPLSIAAALALGLGCGSVFAAQPETTTPTIGFDAAPPLQQQTGEGYYLQRIPGTQKARKVYLFSHLDSNHNGQLSRAELPSEMRDLRLHFVEADWDGNGQLSAQEYRHYAKGTVPKYVGVFHAQAFYYGPYGRR